MALFSVLGASPAAMSSELELSSFSSASSHARVLRVASSKRRVCSRTAMIGFASAIAVEVSTGKGFLENFGVATPALTLALVVSGLVVGLAVFFLLQSGSQD